MGDKNCDTGDPSLPVKKESQLIPGYKSIEHFTKDGFKTLMEAIKHSNSLPSGRDWDFYSTSESFKRIVNDESNDVLRLMNQVMRYHDIDSNIRNRVLDEKIELVIEANDVILEKVANNIDEINGIKKATIAPVVLQTVSAQLPINGSWNRPNNATFSVNSGVPRSAGKKCIKLLTAKNIVRPQKFFKDQIDNRNNVPWCPRIKDKPNSLKPLAIFLEECGERQEYSHPYEYELDRFAPTSEQLLEEKPVLPKLLSDTLLIEINKPEQLHDLVETLRQCKEFAVDVEHHSYRSFMGITCLLQISTPDKDYLIDTLALRDKLCILNEVFTKNTIVKIFHGAEQDIEWLQRDLSIYVVNLFDTHQAAKMLQYPGLSLAFLMRKFCNIIPDKAYQLADWRIRPLPAELKAYAREDTHYLIYIYKMLKNELLAKANKSDNLLRSVIEQSTEVCKKRYFKPILHDDSHMGVLRKCKKMFDNRQLYALKEIYAWRDFLAREEDESCGYVLPNHMMLQIAESLPREMQGILACCNPIPPLVKSNLLQLHQIILKARDQALEKAIMKDTTGRGVLKETTKVNVDSPLHCPHDLSKSNEFRDDLPTLLHTDAVKIESGKLANTNLSIEKSSFYSIFDEAVESDIAFNERETFKKLRGFAYFSPYERYKLVKPFVVAEDKEAESQKAENRDKQQQETTPTEAKLSERSDEDRIASIRDHFVQLSKKFSEELQQQKEKEEEEQRQREQSLIQMGGSRKRKREDNYSYAEEPMPPTDFHCPIPKMNHTNFQYGNNRNRGKKRKINELDNQGETQLPQKATNKKQKKGKQNKQQQTNRQQQNKRKQQANQQQQNNSQGNHKQQLNWQQMIDQPQQVNWQDQRNYQEVNQQRQKKQKKGNQQQNNQNQSQQQPKKKKQHPNQRGGFQRPETATKQTQHQKNNRRNMVMRSDDTNFSPYDYASVDFRQFQGGGGAANSGTQIKSKFKPKNWRNKNKKGAKSSTFGNARPNRGGFQGGNF